MKEYRSERPGFRVTFKKADILGRTVLLLSSWFGTGLVPVFPGTFGSLAALPLLIVYRYGGYLYGTLLLIVLIPSAILLSGKGQKLLDRDDPPEIVIDEVVGMLIALYLMPLSILKILSGFLIFRFFDILKPFPIGMVDRKIRGGIGIVADDILAGIFANFFVRIMILFFSS